MNLTYEEEDGRQFALKEVLREIKRLQCRNTVKGYGIRDLGYDEGLLAVSDAVRKLQEKRGKA